MNKASLAHSPARKLFRLLLPSRAEGTSEDRAAGPGLGEPPRKARRCMTGPVPQRCGWRTLGGHSTHHVRRTQRSWGRRPHEDTRQRTEGVGDRQGRARRAGLRPGGRPRILCASPWSCRVCLGRLRHCEEESKLFKEMPQVFGGHLESPTARDTPCPGSLLGKEEGVDVPESPRRTARARAPHRPQRRGAPASPLVRGGSVSCDCVTAPLPGRSLERSSET